MVRATTLTWIAVRAGRDPNGATAVVRAAPARRLIAHSRRYEIA
jgi:hypothetical protein